MTQASDPQTDLEAEAWLVENRAGKFVYQTKRMADQDAAEIPGSSVIPLVRAASRHQEAKASDLDALIERLNTNEWHRTIREDDFVDFELDDAPNKVASALSRRLRDVEKERDEWRTMAGNTQEALQTIGEEFGVLGGEPRVDGIRRVLTEQRAEVARLTERLTEVRELLQRAKPYLDTLAAYEEANAILQAINAKEAKP